MKNLKSMIFCALVAMTGACCAQGANCITFSADKAFGIRLRKGANAPAVTLEYSTDLSTWSKFSDETDYAAAKVGGIYKLHIRGTGNRTFTVGSTFRAIRCFTNTVNSVATEIACSGNIETLLDYATVASGGHPSMNDYAFSGLFNGFTTLTSAPDFLGTTQTDCCYLGMFKNCTSLRSAPAIIAGTISRDNSCGQMFWNCTSLTNAPVLPATTMVSACYSYMFYGCASLLEPPALPATTLAASCYTGMFGGCKSLKSAPALPVTTLASGCYSGMFNGCTSLKSAPALPATTLAASCYNNMFKLCTSLTDIPALNVSILTNSCCGNMFANCSNLVVNTTGPGKEWRIPSTAQIASTATISSVKTYWATNMFANTAGDVGAGAEIVPGKTYYIASAPKETDCITFSADKAFGIQLYRIAGTTAVNLEWSTDQFNWSTLNANTDYPAGNDGSLYKFHVRGTGNTAFGSMYGNRLNKFTNTVASVATAITCSGNAETILDYATVKAGGHPTMGAYAFNRLFGGFTLLTSAPALPATNLVDYCYAKMFFGCRSLTNAPALPAATAPTRCYDSMFYGCSSLPEAPALPATTLGEFCYCAMFQNCTSLKSASALSAMTLAKSCCALMFRGCTSLTNAPALSATTLAQGCYSSMFNGCTSLKAAPALPAVTLAQSCYGSMFSSCKSLIAAPELPATTLEEGCYSGMFSGCTSLTTIPALDVALVTNSCCSLMFRNCSNLVVNTTGPGKKWKIPSTAQIASTATISEKTYWATNMFANTAGDVGAGAEIVPGKTYYVGATKVKDLGDGLSLWQYDDDYGVKGEGVLTSDKTKELTGLGVRGLCIGDGITAIGDYAFQRFYALTNVTCAASVASVGIGAFSRCLGLEALTFEGTKPTLGNKAFTVRAGIRMEDDKPVVYPIPKVTYAGEEPTLYGKTNLTDVAWQTVTPANKGDFHFFTYDPPSK